MFGSGSGWAAGVFPSSNINIQQLTAKYTVTAGLAITAHIGRAGYVMSFMCVLSNQILPVVRGLG